MVALLVQDLAVEAKLLVKMKQALLIFVKNAVKGKVKTRIAATLGDETALAIYQHLLRHTVRNTQIPSLRKFVYYAEYLEYEDIFSNEQYEKQIQIGDDLGARMQAAFTHAFLNGNERVAIIGSDCLEITTEIIENAFEQLDHNDVVIGPALDGGYYLLATKTIHSGLFENINWSTDQVLAQTLNICRRHELSVAQLQVLSDIDTEEDLKRLAYYSIRKT